MWFDSDDADRQIMLNMDGVEWRNKVFFVKKAAFGRTSSGLGVPMEEKVCFRTKMSCLGIRGRWPVLLRWILGPLQLLSWANPTGMSKSGGCMVKWKMGCCEGFQASVLSSDLGAVFSVVKIDMLKCLLLFEIDKGSRATLSLDGLWWSSRGIMMTPWSVDLVLNPVREAWIRCIGIPLHARCSGTFMAIGQQMGEVLMIEFGSLASGVLEDGRIHVLTDIPSLNRAFTLKVDGFDFSCEVVEDCAATTQSRQEADDHQGTSDLVLDSGIAMDFPERKHGFPAMDDLSPSDDGDRAVLCLSEDAGVRICPNFSLSRAEDGLEEDLLSDSLRLPETRHEECLVGLGLLLGSRLGEGVLVIGSRPEPDDFGSGRVLRSVC
ncbi:hypothetical protein Dimus_034354 [Dionaea muscipula]